MKTTVIQRARVFDSIEGALLPEQTIVIRDGAFADVLPGLHEIKDADETINAQGRVALPGLIDCHVHVMAVTHDVFQLGFMPPSLITAHSTRVMEDMLLRGYTTVRDAAGADFGLREAVDKGIVKGPRLFIAGHPLSQTGGHADSRRAGQQEIMCTCAGLGLFGAIADGDAQVRKAVREQLRNGANQIKVMAGGGIASPTDPIDGTQYSMAELTAIVEEVDAANTYAMAHAYSPRAITRAVQAGIRTIEHGNLMDEASARAMKKAGAYYVPTLATYHSFLTESDQSALPQSIREKLDSVAAFGIRAIEIARAEGVPIAWGTDLLGKYHHLQNEEFRLRSATMSCVEMLQSATHIGARVLRRERELGVIARGARADLLLVDGEPTRDVESLVGLREMICVLMKDGVMIRQKLN
jgi:imidazolonepropionase-like amidohydrolase